MCHEGKTTRVSETLLLFLASASQAHDLAEDQRFPEEPQISVIDSGSS